MPKYDKESERIIRQGFEGSNHAFVNPNCPEAIDAQIKLRRADIELLMHKMKTMDHETIGRAERTIENLHGVINWLRTRKTIALMKQKEAQPA